MIYIKLKPFLFFLILMSLSCVTVQSQIKDLYPIMEWPLNLSYDGEKIWQEQQTLGFTAMEKLYQGDKEEDLAEDEQRALENLDETKDDYWETIGSGCSWYCGGGPKEVTGSSYLQSQSSNSYEPQNAHDFSYKEAWVEGVDGYGIGEYLSYKFDASSPRISEIIVVNGYVKSAASYRDNCRVKKLKVYIDDKPYAILNLNDERSAQHFKVGPLGISEREDWNALKNLPNWTLKFEIMEVYKGDRYEDTVISEIYFDGLDVHCFAKGIKIMMSDSSEKNIETLIVGDQVKFYDFTSGLFNDATILKLEKAKHQYLVKYTFASGRTIIATKDHPLFVEIKGWCSFVPDQSKQYKGFDAIQKIELGDKVKTNEGSDQIRSITYIKQKQQTYTISLLSEGNNFVANGIVVGVEEVVEQQQLLKRCFLSRL